MYKYRQFPIIKVLDVPGSLTLLGDMYYYYISDIIILEMNNNIVSNEMYTVIVSNTIVFGSNGTEKIVFTNSSINEKLLYANRAYIVKQTASTVRITDYTNKVYYEYQIGNLNNFRLMLGNGDSSICAFAEQTYNGILTYCQRKRKIMLIDFVNRTTNQLPDAVEPVAFSPKNKYFFFTIFNNRRYSYLQIGDKDSIILTNMGMFSVYEIATKQNTPIGNYEEEMQDLLSHDWTDMILGITRDLKHFYVFETTTGPNTTYNYNDGRMRDQIPGVWRIDISSLNLTE